MRSRAKVIGAAVGGAAVLASGAYALGAQSGNGNAEAAAKAGAAQTQQGYGAPGGAKRGDCGPRGRAGAFRARGERLSAAAKKLGVSEAKLRDALQAVRKDLFDGKNRPDSPAKARDAFTAALAKELGVSQDAVESALPNGPGPGGHGRMGRHGGPGGHGAPGGPPPGGGYGMPPAPPAAP